MGNLPVSLMGWALMLLLPDARALAVCEVTNGFKPACSTDRADENGSTPVPTMSDGVEWLSDGTPIRPAVALWAFATVSLGLCLLATDRHFRWPVCAALSLNFWCAIAWIAHVVAPTLGGLLAAAAVAARGSVLLFPCQHRLEQPRIKPTVSPLTLPARIAGGASAAPSAGGADVYTRHGNVFKCTVCDVVVPVNAAGKPDPHHSGGKKHAANAAKAPSAAAPHLSAAKALPPLHQTQNKNETCACGSGKQFGKCCGKQRCPCRSGKMVKNCCSKATLLAPGCSGAASRPVHEQPRVELVDVAGPEMSLAEQIAADDGATNSGGDTRAGRAGFPPNAFDILAKTHFGPETLRDDLSPVRTTLYGGDKRSPPGVELGLLGHVLTDEGSAEQLHINVSDPFCLITVGVQGSGKSHTLNCVLEACLIQCPPITHVHQPMSALVCHYDRSDVNCCEATGLGQPSREIAMLLRDMRSTAPAACVAQEDVLVLCSPSFYQQRREYYAGICEVRPLLFPWGRLKAQQIKMLMKLDESSTQLYVALMLDMLRGYQREAKLPAFQDFVCEFEAMCSKDQSGPLKQRFQLLSSLVFESQINEPLRDVGVDLADVMAAGRLVVVDLTDPMMSPADANCIFQVALDTFRCKQLDGCGKVVAFDEAHRYMGMQGTGDALAMEITDCARLMRHEGLRVLISTQSPKAMPEELLELTSVLVAHRFQSIDWHHHLARKVPLPDDSFATIRALGTGEALVYSARPRVDDGGRREAFRVQMRKRLTADRGASRRNREARGTTVGSENAACANL
jgi:hypothetical protein